MSPVEELIDCLLFYKLPVHKTEGQLVHTLNGYTIEAEANGPYKLLQHGEVVAPFDDLNELCQFMLAY
jgi:hypothetical protein